MKKAEEYLKEHHFHSLDVLGKVFSADEHEGSMKERLLEAFKQAQLDAIEEACKICVENATASEYWGDSVIEPEIIVSKSSILNCAEILKQQLKVLENKPQELKQYLSETNKD